MVFADLITDYRKNTSGPCRIEVPDVENLNVFHETIELMFDEDIEKKLLKVGVFRALDILEGVLTPGRVRLLLYRGTAGFRGYGRRNGERRRKSVRGCIVSPDLSVLNLVIVKKGDNDLPGPTDVEKPRMRGPKRASKIRKLFNLSKEDDVRKILGDVFMGRYHTEFEGGKLRVGFAEAA